MDAHPTTQQDDNERRISILPPWQEEEDMVVADADVGGKGSFVYSYDHLDMEGSAHLSIESIQWSKEDITNTEFDNENDLSLYLGAEYQLSEVRSYRDLSSITFDDVADIVTDPQNQLKFPVLLHHILSSRKYDDSIMWLPHGRAFVITDREKFFSEVSPGYFCTFEYELFMGWVKAYGLEQMEYKNENGTETSVAFYHESFLRSRPWLAFVMKPGANDAVPSAQSVYRTQQVFQIFDEFPFLQDIPVSCSSPMAHQVMNIMAHQLPMMAHFYNSQGGQSRHQHALNDDGAFITMTD
mmetsp:Transcript_19479/g.42348  ORF Transcript_19479/g.42348 Transcript_19479/m.42348 type:complete len:297 (+) Transcript_19479:135-1025(+)